MTAFCLAGVLKCHCKVQPCALLKTSQKSRSNSFRFKLKLLRKILCMIFLKRGVIPSAAASICITLDKMVTSWHGKSEHVQWFKPQTDLNANILKNHRLQRHITVAHAVLQYWSFQPCSVDWQHNPISSQLPITCLPGFHWVSDLWNWLVWLFHRRLRIEWEYKPMGEVLRTVGNWSTFLKWTSWLSFLQHSITVRKW